MLKFLGKLLTALSSLMRRGNPAPRVTLMSRQSAHLSRDYQMLYEELVRRLGPNRVSCCLTEPETKSIFKFIAGTLRQLKATSNARVIVVDGYSPSICIPPKDNRVFVIQLWHAVGAIKKFGYQAIGTPAGRSASYAEIAHMHENYDVIIASGPGAVQAYKEAFGYEEDSILPLGTPELDYLSQNEPNSPRMLAHLQVQNRLPYLKNGNINVLYAPTLRKGDVYEGWGDRYLEALCEACPSKGVNLVFSGHPLEKNAGKDLVKKFSFLHFPQNLPTIDLIESADVIITDYSSLALAAGFLGKNVCFYIPDYDRYVESPGLNVNLKDPGIAFASESAEEIMQAICAMKSENAPLGFDAFKKFASDYFRGVKPGATERIADLICKHLIS